MMNDRLYYLDTLRLLACFLVSFTHSAIPAADSSNQGIYYAFISIVCSPCIGLFFALSGALILPVKTNSKLFYSRKLPKICFPWIFWSIFGIALYFLLNKITFNQSLTNILISVFKPVIGVYWFMYVLLGIYLYAPIISKWLESATKREIEFFLALWLISLSLPLLNYISPDFYNLNGSFKESLFAFSGYFGYALLGYYCRKYPIKIASKFKSILIFISIEICLGGIYATGHFVFDNYATLMDYLVITTGVQVFVIYNFIYNMNDTLITLQPFISSIGKFLFAVYLIHIYVIRDLVWIFFVESRFHPVLETLSVAIISFILSLLFVYVLSLILPTTLKRYILAL